jgi:hypothetical protein
LPSSSPHQKHPRISRIPANENKSSHEATKPRRELEVPIWNLKTKERMIIRLSISNPWRFRPPSTPGRDGSPQPSQTSGATRRHEGRLRLKNGASRRSAPTLVSLPIRDHTSPFAGQRFPLRELVSFEHALDHRMAKKTPANGANPRE